MKVLCVSFRLLIAVILSLLHSAFVHSQNLSVITSIFSTFWYYYCRICTINIITLHIHLGAVCYVV